MPRGLERAVSYPKKARKPKPKRSEIEEVRLLVAAYVAAGADESTQRVVTAVRRLARR